MSEDDPDFEALLEFLKENRGFDFTGYKRSSLVQRVARRTQALGMERWSDYLDYLQVRPEEAVGQHLLNLDIGVATDQLRPLIRQVLTDPGSTTSDELTLDATNRRGRAVQIRVEASPLVYRPGQAAGAIVVMDQLPAPDPS